MSTFGGESGGDNLSRAREAVKLLDIIEDEVNLSDWESRFVADMRQRVEQYGEKTIISVKQLFTLRNIKDKQL